MEGGANDKEQNKAKKERVEEEMQKNRKVGNGKVGGGESSYRADIGVANRSKEGWGGERGKRRHHPSRANKGCGLARRLASEARVGAQPYEGGTPQGAKGTRA